MNKFAGKTLILASLALTNLLTAGSTALASEQKATPAFTLTPQQSFEALVADNARFVTGEATHLRQDVARRAETAEGQHPAALVMTPAGFPQNFFFVNEST